jgi:riboflavin biosynthesis pyrimidine reductase
MSTLGPCPVVSGPAVPFTLLFDDDGSVGPGLPEPFRRAYGGDWVLPVAADRPYTTINFVVSRDGRISYAEHGNVGGASVSEGSPADIWVMKLLRARCDAVLVGDGTVRAESDHRWTVEYLGGVDAAAFTWLRAAEGRAPVPLQAICSLTGAIERDWAVVADESFPLLVATTTSGADEARRRLAGRPNAEVVAFGDDRVDTARLGAWLLAERQIASLLCEGGPSLYGSMVADGAVDDEFVTLAPILIGGISSAGARRPSLVEGVGFAPGASPRVEPVSLRRAGHHLLVRSRVTSAPPVAQSL